MYTYNAHVTRVVDGDTFHAIVDLGFNISFKIIIRLRGIDTPETYRPKSDAEREHGILASSFVKSAIENKDIIITTYKSGASIYGRFEASVKYSKAGLNLDLTEELFKRGFAKKETYQ